MTVTRWALTRKAGALAVEMPFRAHAVVAAIAAGAALGATTEEFRGLAGGAGCSSAGAVAWWIGERGHESRKLMATLGATVIGYLGIIYALTTLKGVFNEAHGAIPEPGTWVTIVAFSGIAAALVMLTVHGWTYTGRTLAHTVAQICHHIAHGRGWEAALGYASERASTKGWNTSLGMLLATFAAILVAAETALAKVDGHESEVIAHMAIYGVIMAAIIGSIHAIGGTPRKKHKQRARIRVAAQAMTQI